MVRTQDIREGVFKAEGAAHVTEETYRERISRAEPRHGDLLYSREGTYFGDAAEVPVGLRVCLGQRMVLLRPNPAIVGARFLRYWLNSPLLKGHIAGHRDGTVAERLNLPTIRGLPVCVPSLPEQQAIAAVLGALDDKIDLNRRLNDTLEEAARALFKSWFIDFDPVRAKAEGRQPFGMEAMTALLLPDGFDAMESGEVPKGWKLATLADVAELNPARPLAKGALAPYVEMASLPTRGHRPTEWRLREAGSGARFANGDTLLARITPCLENGKTGYVDFLTEGEIGWGSTEYIVIRPRPPLPTEWGYLLAREPRFRDFAARKMEGTSGRQRVAAESVARYVVAVPTPEVAAAFGRIVKHLFVRMAAASDETRSLGELRDYLLPKLLSGEVRVRDAEKLVEAAS